MTGNDIICELKKKFGVTTDRDLSAELGLSIPAIHNWKKRQNCTLRQLAGLVHSASKTGGRRSRENMVHPLVEFFEVHSAPTKSGTSRRLFGTRDSSGRVHPYYSGLQKELEQSKGVYIFFDSRGQAIYVGKAKRQSLWKEMNLALNRNRGEVQTIKRVRHPARRVEYRPSDETTRQIVDQQIPLWDLARYFSAYRVDLEMIEDMEALLVRSFANDLLNKRMERFVRQRKS